MSDISGVYVLSYLSLCGCCRVCDDWVCVWLFLFVYDCVPCGVICRRICGLWFDIVLVLVCVCVCVFVCYGCGMLVFCFVF